MAPSTDWREHGPGELAPADDAIDVWTWDIEAPRDGDRDLLTDDERARADRLVIPSKGASWTASRAGLRRVLAPYVGRAAEDLCFVTGQHGKPALDDDAITFNLSHSGSRAVLAITPRALRLGVDVEQARDGRAFESIARSFFADDERRRLLQTDALARARVFYRYWTCKEAYLKAWGTGLTFASSRFCVELMGDEPERSNETVGQARVVATQMPGDDDPSMWSFRTFGIDAGYPVALCWEGGPLRIRTATARL